MHHNFWGSVDVDADAFAVAVAVAYALRAVFLGFLLWPGHASFEDIWVARHVLKA